jgi:iron complex outermembrane receptor protein
MNVFLRERFSASPATGQVKRVAWLGTALACMGSGGTAAAATPDQHNALEVVIVTATKREENIQDVPMSLSVIGNAELESRTLVGMDDYMRSIPGASLLSQGPGFNAVVLRGVAINGESDGDFSGPITGVYFGETPISGLGASGGSADIKLVDMQRVEVLKGPQGTLYGAGAMGGVVRSIPNAPNLQRVEGMVEADYSITAGLGSDNNRAQGVINIPLVQDKLALRAVGYRFEDSGYYRNVSATDPAAANYIANFGARGALKGDIGATETRGGRASLLWQLTDDFSAELGYLQQEIDQDGWGQSDFRLGDGYEQSRLLVRRGSTLANAGAPVNPDGLSDTVKLGNAKLTYNFAAGSLVSTTSRVEESTLLLRYINLGYPWNQNINYGGDAVIEEARFISDLKGPLNFIVGYYYEDRQSGTRINSFWGGDNALIPAGFSALRESVLNRQRYSKHQAIFGEVNYKVIEKVTLTAGVRGFDQKRTVVSSIFTNPGTASGGTYKASTSDALFKAGADYRPVDGVMLYANWSQGFRLGDVQAPNQQPSCDANNDGRYDAYPSLSTGSYPIESDRVDQYQVGTKLSLANGRALVNSSAYQTNWKEIPFSFVPGCGSSIVVNAGEARIRGVEMDSSVSVTDAVSVYAAAAYVHGIITKSGAALGAAALGRNGDRLPGTPEYKVSGGVEYKHEIAGNEAYIRGDVAYTGDFYSNLIRTGQRAGGYTNFDANAGIKLGAFDIGIYAKNITNNDDISAVYVALGGASATRLQPRTIGALMRYGF